jgi:hypothetical protein
MFALVATQTKCEVTLTVAASADATAAADSPSAAAAVSAVARRPVTAVKQPGLTLKRFLMVHSPIVQIG